jgi:effector-binding domain-containing protein
MRAQGSSRLIAFVGILVISFLLFPHKLMAIEELKYRVLEKAGDFELRQYQPYVVAETLVEGSFQHVGNEGFRRLFAYIQGKNRQQQAIPMTAPVGQEKVGGKWRITFVMPSPYTRQTLPEPLDPRIKLMEVPGTLMAAVRYSGLWSQSRYEAQENRLREFIRQRGLKIVGEPIFARYNSPFMLWFLRRNEVLIPVARAQ